MTESTLRPVAFQYFMLFLAPSLRNTTSVRNIQEMKCMALILDCLIKKEWGKAADLVGQRLKALERAGLDGNWTRAQYQDLTPPEQVTLTDRSEEVAMRKDVAQDIKYGLLQMPKGKGKGDGKDSKGMKGGKKGKDKYGHEVGAQ
eukprot:6391407-Amphidinium_carterae.1